MKNNHLLSIVFIGAALLTACASMPNANLDEARSKYAAAQSDPQVGTLAAIELRQASDALNRAEDAWTKGEDSATVDHLAYVAKQRVAIAQEAANEKAAEAKVANTTLERSQLLLGARTKDLSSAEAKAAAAQARAEAMQLQSEASQEQARQAELRASQIESDLQKELNAKKTDRGLVVTLGGVLFEFNKAELTPGGMRNVQKLAEVLKQYPQRNVLIEGFTDSVGDDGYNQGLSERRANAVRAALVDMGVSADRIKNRGYGKNFPVAANNTAEGRQLNRRVEVIVSDEGGSIDERKGS